MSKTNRNKVVLKKPKPRNPEKVVMDRHYHSGAFRSLKRTLEAKAAQQEIKDYLEER